MKNYLKYFLLIFIGCQFAVFAQANYLEVDHPVYHFLERMETQQIIDNYNSFELPKTRKEIGTYLKIINEYKSKLSFTDRNIFKDFLTEFELEIFGSLENSRKIISGNGYDPFSQKEKYLFYHNNPGKANIFINLIGDGQFLFRKLNNPDKNYSAFAGIIGGEIRGTLLDKFGFSIKGTNGQVAGDKLAALVNDDLKYNYKFNETDESKFYDEAEGYFLADFDLVKFKIGRDRYNIGYSPNKMILGSSIPKFDYLSLNVKYQFLNFSYLHGKLLGQTRFDADSITGGSRIIDEKYFVYHRIGFNISRHIDFGIGEVVIYGERPIDLSYLNPFNFYKNIEHQNRDRDNAILFVDLNNNSIKGLKLYTTFLIDDISFSKIGTSWYGNKTAFHFGVFSDLFNNYLPLDLRIDYFRVEPYTYTHRLIRNNYTNYGYNLTSGLQPNSEIFSVKLNYRFTNRLKLSGMFSYNVHGANLILNNGTIKNVGGNLELGHRKYDSEKVAFLDGDLEYSREFSTLLSYEPFNQIYFILTFNYLNKSLQKSVDLEEINSVFALSITL